MDNAGKKVLRGAREQAAPKAGFHGQCWTEREIIWLGEIFVTTQQTSGEWRVTLPYIWLVFFLSESEHSS